MEEKNIAIIIALLVVIVFFGGWYIFFGQIFNQGTDNLPVEEALETHNQLEPSVIVTPDTSSSTPTTSAAVETTN